MYICLTADLQNIIDFQWDDEFFNLVDLHHFENKKDLDEFIEEIDHESTTYIVKKIKGDL